MVLRAAGIATYQAVAWLPPALASVAWALQGNRLTPAAAIAFLLMWVLPWTFATRSRRAAFWAALAIGAADVGLWLQAKSQAEMVIALFAAFVGFVALPLYAVEDIRRSGNQSRWSAIWPVFLLKRRGALGVFDRWLWYAMVLPLLPLTVMGDWLAEVETGPLVVVWLAAAFEAWSFSAAGLMLSGTWCELRPVPEKEQNADKKDGLRPADGAAGAGGVASAGRVVWAGEGLMVLGLMVFVAGIAWMADAKFDALWFEAAGLLLALTAWVVVMAERQPHLASMTMDIAVAVGLLWLGLDLRIPSVQEWVWVAAISGLATAVWLMNKRLGWAAASDPVLIVDPFEISLVQERAGEKRRKKRGRAWSEPFGALSDERVWISVLAVAVAAVGVLLFRSGNPFMHSLGVLVSTPRWEIRNVPQEELAPAWQLIYVGFMWVLSAFVFLAIFADAAGILGAWRERRIGRARGRRARKARQARAGKPDGTAAS